jgi:hypothetical protein
MRSQEEQKIRTEEEIKSRIWLIQKKKKNTNGSAWESRIMRDPKAQSGAWDVVDATGLVLGSNDGRQGFLWRPDKGLLERRGGHCQPVKHTFP